MKKDQSIGLNFVVDKLTNSVENVVTGDSFKTEISILTKTDLKLVTKKSGWLFDWKKELKEPVREVYKLTIVGNPTVIQGLISMEIKENHVYCNHRNT